MVTNEQLYLAIMIPMLSSAVVILLGIVFFPIRGRDVHTKHAIGSRRGKYSLDAL